MDVTAAAAAEHTSHVFKVLAEIGAEAIPQIVVLNKVDALEAGERDFESVRQRVLAGAGPHGDTRAVAVSARTGEGIDRLLALVDELLPLDLLVRARFRFSAAEAGARLALLHEYGRVLETSYSDEACEVEAEVPESLLRRLPPAV